MVTTDSGSLTQLKASENGIVAGVWYNMGSSYDVVQNFSPYVLHLAVEIAMILLDPDIRMSLWASDTVGWVLVGRIYQGAPAFNISEENPT